MIFGNSSCLFLSEKDKGFSSFFILKQLFIFAFTFNAKRLAIGCFFLPLFLYPVSGWIDKNCFGNSLSFVTQKACYQD